MVSAPKCAVCYASFHIPVFFFSLGECRALRKWMLQLAHALEICHSNGIALRDGESLLSANLPARIQPLHFASFAQ